MRGLVSSPSLVDQSMRVVLAGVRVETHRQTVGALSHLYSSEPCSSLVEDPHRQLRRGRPGRPLALGWTRSAPCEWRLCVIMIGYEG